MCGMCSSCVASSGVYGVRGRYGGEGEVHPYLKKYPVLVMDMIYSPVVQLWYTRLVAVIYDFVVC